MIREAGKPDNPEAQAFDKCNLPWTATADRDTAFFGGKPADHGHETLGMNYAIAGGRTLRDWFAKNDGCHTQAIPEPAANSLKQVCCRMALARMDARAAIYICLRE
jgi:hypothetical protein